MNAERERDIFSNAGGKNEATSDDRRERKTLPLFSSTNEVILFPSDKDFLKKNKNVLCGIFERVCVFTRTIYRVKCDTSGRRYEKIFCAFLLFITTFRMAKCFLLDDAYLETLFQTTTGQTSRIRQTQTQTWWWKRRPRKTRRRRRIQIPNDEWKRAIGCTRGKSKKTRKRWGRKKKRNNIFADHSSFEVLIEGV